MPTVEFVPRPFQTRVAASESTITLATAGCGSGRVSPHTSGRRGGRSGMAPRGGKDFRLFFCLPTTGTATEHFKDYALEAKVPASLAHSRATIDLESIAATAPQEDSTAAEREKQAAESRNIERREIEALELWGTPVVVATSDTVLGLMANTLRALVFIASHSHEFDRLRRDPCIRRFYVRTPSHFLGTFQISRHCS